MTTERDIVVAVRINIHTSLDAIEAVFRVARQLKKTSARRFYVYLVLYDPETTSVVVVIKRIKHVRTFYGRKEVLKVLPLCLRGKALDWYTHLSEYTTEEM
jgi:hypothetical protein